MTLPALVDGATRLFAIVGDPIAQAKSPEVFSERFRNAGLNALMLPMQVKSERFDETIRGIKALANLDGIIATIPYKARILEHVDLVHPTGRRVGAINAIRREADGAWAGDMFDGKGLVAGLRASGMEPNSKRVFIMGAGGAGSAIADALAAAGARSITLYDEDKPKAKALVARIREAHPTTVADFGTPTVEGQDILINATPVGMSPDDGLPAQFASFPKDLFVVDIVPRTDQTAFLIKARAAGCRTMAGKAMVTGQVEEILRFFGIG